MSDVGQANLEGVLADSAAAGGRRSNLVRLLLMAWECRWNCVSALFWSLAVQGVLLVGLLFSGVALDLLRAAGDGESLRVIRWPFGIEPPADWDLTEKVMLSAGLVLGLTVVGAFLHYASRMADERLVQKIIVNLRVRLYAKLQRMSFSYFDVQDSGTLINRVTGDAASVRLFIQNVLIRMLITVATLVLFVGYMMREHFWLTLAVMSVIPLQVLFVRRYTVQIRPQFVGMRQSMDRLIQGLQESILGVRVIRGFGQEKQIVDRLDGRNTDAQTRRMEIVRTSAVHMPAVNAINFVQLAILLWYGGFLVYWGSENGGIELGAFWVFLALISKLSVHVDRIVQSAATIPEAMTGAERVFELLDAPIEIEATAGGWAGGEDAGGVKGRIEFEEMSFRYVTEDGDGPMVLENVSLVIEAGETIAIVGPAGSGKTTLLNLIGRLYGPVSGRVLVDGVDVRDWDLGALRRVVGYAMQEPFLFSNSITKNIAFGDQDAAREAIERAATEAAAAEFVEETEFGYETIVGERGLTLSGGERQRLSLARTLLMRPPILLLDDATSSVDARTEAAILEALAEIMAGRTTIIVAHRLSTLRQADRIVVLEAGRIASVGTHSELMASNDHYRQAAEIQLELELAEEEEEEEEEEAEAEDGGDGLESGVVE